MTATTVKGAIILKGMMMVVRASSQELTLL